MCLNKVQLTHTQPSSLVVDGWKSFRGGGAELEFENYGGKVPLDTWLQAEKIHPPTTVRATDGKSYKAGFHVYASDGKQQSDSSCRRVFVRRITCEGDQGGSDCVIAQEMYVPSKTDAWPPLGSTPAPAPATPTPTAPAPAASKPKSDVKKMLDRLKGKKGE